MHAAAAAYAGENISMVQEAALSRSGLYTLLQLLLTNIQGVGSGLVEEEGCGK